MRKELVTWDQVEAQVGDLCQQIANDGWRPDYVVGITRGGNIPATMISHYFDVRCEALKISLRDQDGVGSETNCWMAEDAFGCVPYEKGEQYGSRWDPAFRKNILVVDDINDTGATFNWLMDDWTSSCLPNETDAWNAVWGKTTRFAVLQDNLASDFELKVNYAAQEIDKTYDPVWIDYPWESWWKR